jgi:protein required for attachment to host cells
MTNHNHRADSVIWVLIADEAIVRILHWPGAGRELVPVEELTDPDAHAKSSAFRNDAYGRRSPTVTSGGGGHGTPMLGGADATASVGDDELHEEAGNFARRVAQHLLTAHRQRRFDELRIVAAPRFLGELRKALDPEVAGTVADEQSKDLVHETNDVLTARLFPQPHGDR